MPHTSFNTAQEFYDHLSELKERFYATEPELVITVTDTGLDIEGYVVVWNTDICKNGPFDRNGNGIGKGGTRITPDLMLDDIKRLARSMAEKNAAAGLPLGGAKSGLRCDPDDLEYEKKYRRFVKLVQEEAILAEQDGIFGGFGFDIGNKPPLNALWACDELGSLDSFTGKPVEMGGTDYDREGIAGLGVATAARTLTDFKNEDMNNVTFSVQGLGAMGAAVVNYFSKYGGTLTYLSDPKYGGTWHIEKGASQNMVDAIYAQEVDTVKSLLGKEGQLISDDPSDALYADAMIIFPCAFEDVLTKDNAEKIKAPYICEGANNPTTDEAHEILFNKGTLVIPDIIANPGGIIAAFVELSSDISAEENAKTHKKVLLAKEETIARITTNTRNLLDISTKLNVRPDKVGDYMAYRNIFHGIPLNLVEGAQYDN